MKRRFFLAIPLAAMSLLSSAEKVKNPVEAGVVKWKRDYDDAIQKSAKTGKPVFLLFQEIPGCAGCKEFGRTVLSDPQMAEAIESEFIPLLIPNNQAGQAEEILKRFDEPSWNFQVIRFLNAKGEDLIPRKDNVWTTSALAARMENALEKAGKTPPKYLKALGAAGDGAHVASVAFSMFCFWTGEAKLGSIPGVIETEAGWFSGREVTLVKYRTDQISLESLTAQAAKFDCADQVFLTEKSDRELLSKSNSRLAIGELNPSSYRPAKSQDQKRQIQGTALSGMKLSPTQAMQINSLIRVSSKEALSWLSPRQRDLLEAR